MGRQRKKQDFTKRKQNKRKTKEWEKNLLKNFRNKVHKSKKHGNKKKKMSQNISPPWST